MQDKTKRLWDREISTVEDGLDEEQVVGFLGELMAKYRALLERQVHFVSLGTLSEKSAVEADKLAREIKSRASAEAEAEAKSIVASANQRAQEMLAIAKKTAQDVNRREVDSIIGATHRKAAVIDTEAKQRAQLFLLSARSIIEEDLKDQFRDVYNQLLSNLRDLLNEGHDIEAGWKAKLAELWKREALELEGFEAMPALMAAEMAKAASLAGIENEVHIEMPKEESLKQKPYISEIPVASPVTAGIDALVSEVIGEVDEEPEKVAGGVEPVAEIAETVNEGIDIVAGVMPAQARVRPVQEVKPAYIPSAADLNATYEGEVELSLVPPIELATMSRIYDQLQLMSEIKILRTVGAWDKGTTITALLEKPIPLLGILLKIQGVTVAPEQIDKDGSLKDRDREKKKIALKTQ